MKTIRLAWKALARFRTYTFINILGLALSLACVLIILRYIHQEVTVNHFCKDLENTYLLYIEYEDGRRTIASETYNLPFTGSTAAKGFRVDKG